MRFARSLSSQAATPTRREATPPGSRIKARVACWNTATSASWQSPYLDPELVDFVRRIPPERMFHNGWSRGLYREAFRGLMPERVRQRRTKSGVAEAVREGVRGAGGICAFEDLLTLRR